MNRVYPVLLFVTLTFPAIQVSAAAPTPASIQSAINEFTPLWVPPRGELAGCVVALDPGDVAPLATDQRVDDDLSLLTAGHLYHLIDLAGGGAVLLRSDDTLSTDAGRSRRAQRFEAARARECDICLVVRYASGIKEASVSAGGDRPRDAQVTEALQAALGARAQSSGSALRGEAPGPPHPAAAMCFVELPRPVQTVTADVASRRICVENARRLYAGIRAFFAPAPAESQPAGRGGDTPDVRGPARDLGRKLWPAGHLPDDQVDWFCRLFSQICVTNSSLVYFDVAAVVDDGVTLSGSSNVPLLVRGLEEAIRDVSSSRIRTDIRGLPDREQLGERLYGLCRAPMALTSTRPGNKGGRQTQLLYGEPLFLLDHREGCYLLHAGDGYWGWTEDTAIEPLPAGQFDAYLARPAATVLRDIARDGLFIPRSARVRLAGPATDAPHILLTDGTELAVPSDALRTETPDNSAERRAVAALELLYLPYIFGGRSPLGVDCSGLVTSAWMRDGRYPARDVWQQAFAGQLVATAWHRTNIRLGDQLFFIHNSGKLYHTAVALDATHFVHSSPPGVQIGSFDPRDRLYDAECDQTFFMAKRQ